MDRNFLTSERILTFAKGNNPIYEAINAGGILMKKCPYCDETIQDDHGDCPNCQKNLGQEDSMADDGSPRWVQIYATGDPGSIALIKSILEGNGISYFIDGEELQNLFALGILGVGFNPVAKAAKVLVREEDAEKAVELLSLLDEEEAESGAPEEEA